MKPQFKIGAAKLRNGAEAYVFEVLEDRVLGKFLNTLGRWMASTWFFDDPESSSDILPNNVPEKIVIESVGWFHLLNDNDDLVVPSIQNKLGTFHKLLPKLRGKTWTMTLEEQDT